MKITDQIARTLLLEPLYEDEHKLIEDFIFSFDSFQEISQEHDGMGFNLGDHIENLKEAWGKVESVRNPDLFKIPITEI